MADKLYYFACKNPACEDRVNYVNLPDGEYKRTKYLLYCWDCGVCLLSDETNDVIESDKSWLPCIPFTGQGSQMTRGPVSDSVYGYKWGDPSSNDNLTEEEFMKKYKNNPRREWCKRTNHKNKTICKGKEAIKPVTYGKVDVIRPVTGSWDLHTDLSNRRRG